ncbi:MAG: hypothetical protein ACYDBB_20795 [Armatimonadota bacterium]
MPLAIFAGLLVVLLLAPRGGGAPELRLEPGKPDVRMTVQAKPKVVLIDIYSPSGIGSARGEITSGRMQESLLFRLHLKGLENFRFSYDHHVIEIAASSSGERQIRQYHARDDAPNAPPEPLTADSPYWMPVSIVPPDPKAGDGYFEIAAPPDFLHGQSCTFSLQWIDFYRG